MDAQEARLRAYCAMVDIELVTVYREEGVSAAKPLATRPRGAELAKLVDRRKVGHIVALKLDRLFRDAGDALAHTRAWDRSGVTLHLVDMGGQTLNTASAMGRLLLTMTAAFAELERNLIAERTAAAMQHKKAQRRVYSPIPLGFDRVGDALVENPGELAAVRRIRELRADGRTFLQIADQLEHEGIETKRGGRWYASTVRYIVRNDLYEQAG